MDAQNGFVNENSSHVVPRIRALAQRWLSLGEPVYMSQFTNRPGSQWERFLNWSRLNSEVEIALTPELADVAQHAVTYRKQTYSCLVGPFLDDAKRSNWDNVVICGIATDSCVLATAIDLFEFRGEGIRPIVVRDACASHAGEPAHSSGLFIIERFIGANQIVSMAELMADQDDGPDATTKPEAISS